MTDSSTTSRSARRGGHASSHHRRTGPNAPTSEASPPATRRRVFLVAGAILTVVLLAVAADVALSADRIHPGVAVGDVGVGRMRVPEAAAAIDEESRRVLGRPVALVAGDQQWDVTAEQVGASIDATGLARAAYGIGRSDSFMTSVGERIAAWVGRRDLAFVASADPAALDSLFTTIDEAVGTPAVDATIVIEGTTPTIVAPTDGRGIDRAAVSDALLGAFTSEDRSVDLVIVDTPAAVREDGAADALESATRMLSAPVKLTYEGKSWVIEPGTIASWVAFRPLTADSGAQVLECYLDSGEVTVTLDPLVAEVGKPAKDATFRVSSGTVSIVPSQDGLGLDGEDLIAGLMQTLNTTGERVLELPMKRTEAERTTEEARAMGITERLATFTTDYSPSNKPRVNNIHTLADALDGTLVPPGGVFSFNETIGPRTAEKGYQEANAIVNGKLVPQLGGGVCQVGTTVFNAVFFSGLPVIERRNHSLYISHYP
ncbi:MAG TPA: VanW family protein, partial [Coriobacteriia bacterium]|nr:VanW family protein [Coriobacteriia bacterium]